MKKLILVVPLQERFNEQILAFTTGHKLATTLYNLKEKGSGNMKLLFFALLIYLRVDVSKGGKLSFIVRSSSPEILWMAFDSQNISLELFP